MKYIIFAMLLFLLSYTSDCDADISRYVDEDDIVHYTDAPTDERYKLFMSNLKDENDTNINNNNKERKVAVAKPITAKQKNKIKSAVKKAVLDRLVDPDSAKFGEISIAGNHACIAVNARNSFGGYSGKTDHHVVKIQNEWIDINDENSWLINKNMGCKNLIENLAAKEREEEPVKNAVIDYIKNPSATFGEFSLVRYIFACIVIEGRPDKQVFLYKDKDKWNVLSINIKGPDYKSCDEIKDNYISNSRVSR